MITAFDPYKTYRDPRLVKFIAIVCITFICLMHLFSRKVGIYTNNRAPAFRFSFLILVLRFELTFAIFSFRIVQGHFLDIYLHNWALCAWRCQGGWEKRGWTIWKRELQRVLPPTNKDDALQLRQGLALSPIFFGWLVWFKSSSSTGDRAKTECRETSNYVRIKPLSNDEQSVLNIFRSCQKSKCRKETRMQHSRRVYFVLLVSLACFTCLPILLMWTIPFAVTHQP